MKYPKEAIDMAEAFARELGVPESVISRADLEKAAEEFDGVAQRPALMEKLVDAIEDDAMTVVKSAIEGAKRVDGVPENAGDWNAVHRFIAAVTMSLINVSFKIMRYQKEHAQRIVAKKGDTLEELEALTLSMTMFTGMQLILKSHSALVSEHGVLETRNADIHYDRLRGMCEQAVSEKRRKRE